MRSTTITGGIDRIERVARAMAARLEHASEGRPVAIGLVVVRSVRIRLAAQRVRTAVQGGRQPPSARDASRLRAIASGLESAAQSIDEHRGSWMMIAANELWTSAWLTGQAATGAGEGVPATGR